MKPLPEWIDVLFAERRPAKLVFRVDAGALPGLSFGHLSRCLLLADCCRQIFGTECLLLMRNYPEGVRHAQRCGQAVQVFDAATGPVRERDIILEALNTFQAAWLVHDLPYSPLDEALFHHCRKAGRQVLFMDDARFVAPPVTVTLNSSILAPQRLQATRSRSDHLLLGPAYFLHNLTPRSANATAQGKPVVLLTFGGSDPSGLTRQVLQALMRRAWPQLRFQVMLGPGYQQPEAIQALLAQSHLDAQVLLAPADQIAHYRQAALVICAGGCTMYELRVLGVPFFPIGSAPHEGEAVEAFVARGLVADGLRAWHDTEFSRLVQAVESMVV